MPVFWTDEKAEAMLLTNGASAYALQAEKCIRHHFTILNHRVFKIRFVSFLANSLFKDRQFIYSNRQYVVPNDEWLEMLIITSF
jgi:hypothetical protein